MTTDHPLLTRGLVLEPGDLTLSDWPQRAKAAGLTTLALSPNPEELAAFVKSQEGERFLEACRGLGLEVEYELHAGRSLLPRELFDRSPELFRMNDAGERTPDYNLCVHSEHALEFAGERAVTLALTLRPTTGRYFYWGDDGQPWCRCPQCRGLSDSDQALLLENRLLKALRRDDPRARVAHLAYLGTLSPPQQVTPAPGVFLEYAPIRRSYDRPYAAQTGPEAPDPLDLLDANLEVFDRESAQALEYWLDVSRYSGWQRPAVKLPWNRDAFRADVQTYRARGLRHLTSFAVWIDADYLATHGDPPLAEYGEALAERPLPETPPPTTTPY
jgi:hypothetical protein